ncbi:MAG: hypothetical protein ABMA13_06345 [Chthoniobacteraceae bacterium]
MNTVFVGGDYGSFNPENPRALNAYGDFCVTRLGEAVRPQTLVVFASACFESDGERVPGYFKVEAPSLTARRWPRKYQRGAPATMFGQVDFRYDDRAITAMLDGHVELLDFQQLSDMRRWSNQAAETDDSDFTLTTP